jgi:hypothetical protein
MKKLRRAIAAIALAVVFLFGGGPLVHVRADGSGPQGTVETKSGSPSSTSGTLTDQQLAYLLWLILMWLIWGGM